MALQISGTLLELSEVQTISEKFKKREFIVEYINGQYPEYIKFEAVQDKCDLLNAFKEGDAVDVEFNLKGRKWTNPQGEVKYFNSLQAWKITKKGQDSETNEFKDEDVPADFDQGIDEEIPF